MQHGSRARFDVETRIATCTWFTNSSHQQCMQRQQRYLGLHAAFIPKTAKTPQLRNMPRIIDPDPHCPPYSDCFLPKLGLWTASLAGPSAKLTSRGLGVNPKSIPAYPKQTNSNSMIGALGIWGFIGCSYKFASILDPGTVKSVVKRGLINYVS